MTDGKPGSERIGGRQWRTMAGFVQFKRSQEKRMQQAQEGLGAWESQIPELRGATSLQQLRQYVQYIWPRLRELVRFYSSHRVVSRRWDTFIRRERAMGTVVNRLVGGLNPACSPGQREKVVVAFGGASTGHGSCLDTSSRGPAKELERRLRLRARVLVIDEFKTSQLCHTCHQQLRAPRRGAQGGLQGAQQGSLDNKDIFRLRVCEGCKVSMDGLHGWLSCPAVLLIEQTNKPPTSNCHACSCCTTATPTPPATSLPWAWLRSGRLPSGGQHESSMKNCTAFFSAVL